MKKKLLSFNFIFSCIVFILILVLFFLPTGFDTYVTPNSQRGIARVLEVDNSNIYTTGGFINIGKQICEVEVIWGEYRGEKVQSINNLTGRLEFDKIFEPGDKALAVIEYREGVIRFVTLVDHFRLDTIVILFLIFILLLIVYAKWIGTRAIISFILTILSIWKILIPEILRGSNPILISMLLIIFLTIVVILLVGGLNKKSLAAILGSLSGTILTCLLAIIFSKSFNIHGAVLSFSESLLYAGYSHINLRDVLISVVFLASAGALMDLAMDIAASVNEVVEKKPDISTKEAINSGLNVGRAVVGTMTTTLLFAYTSGYLALLMYFMAQGTPVIDMLNIRYISKEIMHTIVGSFGLVTVGPFTAIISGILFTKSFKEIKEGEFLLLFRKLSFQNFLLRK
ncbi:YibE/F family protein [Natronospora cellulosivora (SeqCode)]